MSIRDFFDIRFSYPGYIFVGIFLLINFENLLKLGGNSDLIIGIISILSGGPIGFLISQVWYLTEKRRRGKDVNFICEKLDEDREPNRKIFPDGITKYSYEQKVIVLDFLSKQYREKDMLYQYIDRRWTLYNVLGSTRYSIIIGYFSGFFILIVTHIAGIIRSIIIFTIDFISLTQYNFFIVYFFNLKKLIITQMFHFSNIFLIGIFSIFFEIILLESMKKNQRLHVAMTIYLLNSIIIYPEYTEFFKKVFTCEN
jgi:hypothetical protein